MKRRGREDEMGGFRVEMKIEREAESKEKKKWV